MTMNITRDNATEHELHHWTMEASDLGLPVGRWPTTIPTDLGNGLPFLMQRAERADGDLRWIDYRQCNGCLTLRIFND
jgi:hypothetical protein